MYEGATLKIWWGIKLAVWRSAFATAKLKSAKISYTNGNSKPNCQINIRQYLCNGRLGPNRKN